MKKRIGSYPHVRVEVGGRGVVSQAGAVLCRSGGRPSDRRPPARTRPAPPAAWPHRQGSPRPARPRGRRPRGPSLGRGRSGACATGRARRTSPGQGQSLRIVSTRPEHASLLRPVGPDGDIRDGAWGAELAGDCLTGWPKGLRLIVRKERPHPGAQLRFTEADGMRLTCFATNTIHAPSMSTITCPPASGAPSSPTPFTRPFSRCRPRPGRRPSRSRNWNCPTASGHGPRTVSAPPAPPACATSLFTTPRRTRYGWRSSRSRSTCLPGCPCSP